MKRIGVAFLIQIACCLAVASEPMKTADVTMILQNHDRPFVSKEFAGRLASLVLEEKYPEEFFVASGKPDVIDLGECWSVTLENSVPLDKGSPLPTSNGVLVPKQLTVVIRKFNGEIVAIK